MKLFAGLFNALEMSNKTLDKTRALVAYFSNAAHRDKLWTLALFTGKRPRRTVSTTLMRQWAIEEAGIPVWLFDESYSSVGDLGETIALLLPPAHGMEDKPLHTWMEEIIDLGKKTEEEKKAYVLKAWHGLSTNERFLFNKLIGGSFRIGVSHKLLVNALSAYSGVESSALMHSIMGKWEPGTVDFDDLVQGKYIVADNSKPYPFCLAYPLEQEPEQLGDVSSWQAEYKWDGIRGQVIKRNGELFIWSRGEELVTPQFPELVEIFEQLPGNYVIDGEILPLRKNDVLHFSELQKRLNRKVLSKKILQDHPVGFFAYDMLEWEGEDLRNLPLELRRHKLEEAFPELPPGIRLSEILAPVNWETLRRAREAARALNSEGLMLKQKSSTYHSGRKKGDWWKWKVDPYTIDAVLIYAQKGSGRRSGHYTDFTFAIRNGDQFVSIAKAYSGLTDKEIVEVNKFIRLHAIEKFGPVRTVKPELVFELAFEGIAASSRHKAGVALRFPRILRWRRDKTVDEIDTIETVKTLLPNEGGK